MTKANNRCSPRSWRQVGILSLALIVLAGCAPSTRVVLLPDSDGHVGAVSVANTNGRQTLDQAFAEATVNAAKAAPNTSAPIDRKAFEARYDAVLKAQPTPPRQFTLNFLNDSMELTPASKALLPEVLRSARERAPTEITVFGHADASGNPAYNLALSAKRAEAVARLLRRIDPDLRIDVQYFGDKVPLVPSRPGKAEPRNRRAEIQIL